MSKDMQGPEEPQKVLPVLEALARSLQFHLPMNQSLLATKKQLAFPSINRRESVHNAYKIQRRNRNFLLLSTTNLEIARSNCPESRQSFSADHMVQQSHTKVTLQGRVGGGYFVMFFLRRLHKKRRNLRGNYLNKMKFTFLLHEKELPEFKLIF